MWENPIIIHTAKPTPLDAKLTDDRGDKSSKSPQLRLRNSAKHSSNLHISIFREPLIIVLFCFSDIYKKILKMDTDWETSATLKPNFTLHLSYLWVYSFCFFTHSTLAAHLILVGVQLSVNQIFLNPAPLEWRWGCIDSWAICGLLTLACLTRTDDLVTGSVCVCVCVCVSVLDH